MKPVKGKTTAQTGSTVKTSAGSIYRKTDISQAISIYRRTRLREQEKSPSAEPRKKLQKISSPKKLEETDSDEELRRQVELADFVNPVERFQQSQTIVTSKDTESGGGLSLAIKRTFSVIISLL